MSHRIATRAVPAIILLTLLGTGAAQAFCFLKGNDRRADFSNSRMPAIGFSPAVFQGYPYSPAQPAWYGNPAALPQQPYYDNRYGAGTGLQH
ncbi:MAG TPA: hypothetical protein VM011_06575 [Gammaproteobacteria bacterium]|nr:hypothetical protein [Gammaproteobacteria bacterium]